MNRAEHKAKAEEILREIGETEEKINSSGGVTRITFDVFAAERAAELAKAQVHATLALYPDPTTMEYTEPTIKEVRNGQG